MATLAEKMAQLEAMREARSNSGDTIGSDIFGSWTKELGKVQSSVVSLLDAVIKQHQKNVVATEAGRTDNVNYAIREMLSVILDADKVERERHNRMMDMAESLIPKVSDEQLKAVRMQQLAYREHKKTLEAELNLEKKKYDLQKKDAEAMQKRRVKAIEGERAEANFAIKDKYGTIENAITGLGTSGGDSFGKFLVAGLGRFVKERKEIPIAEAVKEKYDAQVQQQNNIAEAKKALADKEFGTRKEDIEETAAIRAAKQGISDPGSAAELYSARAQKVSDLAKIGESLESALVSGEAQFKMPKMESALADIANAIRGKAPDVAGAEVAKNAEVPVLTKDGITSSVDTETAPKVETAKSAEKNESVASTLRAEIPQKPPEAKPMPKNAKMRKAPRQASSLLTPVAKRTATTAASTAGNAVAAVGKFGSKAGAVSLGGIGAALGGIAAKVGTIASSALKFLGPWGMVASAIMSFDRLVPIFSSGAGAIMDLSKLVIPLLVTAVTEGFAGLMAGLNSLINIMPGMTNLENDEKTQTWKEYYKKGEQKKADVEFEKWQKTKNAITGKTTSVVDTTSARSNRAAVTGVAMYRREMPLTTPSEQAAISAQSQAMTTNAPALSDAMAASMQEQTKQNEAMREAVLAAAKNPGTTPIMSANPALAPYAV